MKKKILMSLFTIAIVGVLIGSGVMAYFSDTETSGQNVFTAGTLDLTVNGGDDPLGALVTLDDMKPCNWEYVYVTLHVYDNNADGWIMFENVVSTEGIDTEPELDDPLNPTEQIADYITVDVTLDGEVIIPPGAHWKLGSGGVIDLGELEWCHTYELVLSFHLQAEVGNWAQGDIATFDIVFGADQVS